MPSHLSFGVVFLSILSYTYSTLKDKHTFLVVGTMSAQNNFEARQSIRSTWQHLTTNRSIEQYFVVGKDFCKIPIEDRISPYSCERLNISCAQTERLSTSRINAARHLYRYNTLFAGFTFLTHHKIIVRSLSILREMVMSLDSVRVRLVDSATHETVVSALFTSSSQSKINKLILSKAVEPFVLPKHFEGQILMDVFHPLMIINTCPTSWNNANGVLSFLQLIATKNEKPISFDSDSCTPVSMTFDIYDSNSLKLHIQSRAARQSKWDDETALLQSRLITESREMKDILFVDVIDVYRNLAKKLLLFLAWISSHKNFSYILKTDDDTFVNLIKVEAELLHVERVKQPSVFRSSYLWWWGSFRENWAVGASGKWREDHYRSLTYPPFPCGAGYVLSQDLVTYLATNVALLHTGFQGEDVSMGIWLAGLNSERHLSSTTCNPATRSNRYTFWNYIDDVTCDAACDVSNYSSWSCDHVCKPSAYNRAQLSVFEMYQTWDVFKRCGSLCNCSSLTSQRPHV